MRSGILIISLIIISFFSTESMSQSLGYAKAEKVGLSTERLTRLNTLMDDYVARKEISGSVTLVARHGQIAHFEAHGFRDVESGSTMKKDTIFRIASMTKIFTSVAALMLYEEGKFLLTDPVSEYIPEFENTTVLVAAPASYEHAAASGYAIVPAHREMTVRHLLNHTSGLSSGLWKRPWINDLYQKELGGEKTLGEKMRKLAKLPLTFHPGDEFEYGFSTDMLAYLIEQVSGMQLDEFFRLRICEPLGMKDTFFYVPDDKLDRLATLYKPAENGGIEVTRRDHRGSKTYFSGAGGLFSTTEDYFRLAQMLCNGGELNGVQLLGKKTVELMMTNSIGELNCTWPQLHGDKFGLGFGIRTERGRFDDIESIGTCSWGGIFNTAFYIDPKEDFVCIFMNQLFPQDHLKIRRQFRVLSFQSIVE